MKLYALKRLSDGYIVEAYRSKESFEKTWGDVSGSEAYALVEFVEAQSDEKCQ